MEGARERGRMAWAWGEAAGREKPGAGGVRGAARAESLSVVSRRPRDPRVAPGPQSRAGSTYLALVEAAAGARVPGVRHGADCAATTLRALPYCPPAAAAPERTTRAAGGGDARRSRCPHGCLLLPRSPACAQPFIVPYMPRPCITEGPVSDLSPAI